MIDNTAGSPACIKYRTLSPTNNCPRPYPSEILNTKMHKADVYSLIDKRKGQIQDYRFTSEIKAELIQQVAANAITGKPTSSRAVSEQINQRCNLVLPDRSVRLHMKKLGLPKISKSLPTLVEDLKKTPSNDH